MLVRASAVGRQTVLTERFSGTRTVIDPYWVLSAAGTYTLSRALEAYLHVQNALNADFDTAYDRPGAARSIAVGLRVSR